MSTNAKAAIGGVGVLTLHDQADDAITDRYSLQLDRGDELEVILMFNECDENTLTAIDVFKAVHALLSERRGTGGAA